VKYLDTKTQTSLRKGVNAFLDISEDELIEIFETLNSEEDTWKWVEDYINSIVIDDTLDYIQMFHLSRRLNGTDLFQNNNLEQLLLTPSPIAYFFKKYDLTFKQGDDHIDMYYKDKLCNLTDEVFFGQGNKSYLRTRLGYKTVKDYCVNGFAFRSYLERNSYFRTLSECPELVTRIADFLEIENMINDYHNNSRNYCLEYLIPMSEIIFDMNNAPKTNQEKTIELLTRSVMRLYAEWDNYDFGHGENLILRLDDRVCVKKEWFIAAEELED